MANDVRVVITDAHAIPGKNFGDIALVSEYEAQVLVAHGRAKYAPKKTDESLNEDKKSTKGDK